MARKQFPAPKSGIVPRLLTGIRIFEQETNGLTLSLSFLLCHPNAEAAQLVIVDDMITGLENTVSIASTAHRYRTYLSDFEIGHRHFDRRHH
jgi:hypothetical protein